MTPTDKLADVVAELRVGDPVKKTSGDYHPSGRLASVYPDPDTGSMRYVMKHDCCGAHHIYNASQLTAASRASVAPTSISLSDPAITIASIRQFGLAPDGSDLRDLESAIASRDAELARCREALKMADQQLYHLTGNYPVRRAIAAALTPPSMEAHK